MVFWTRCGEQEQTKRWVQNRASAWALYCSGGRIACSHPVYTEVIKIGTEVSYPASPPSSPNLEQGIESGPPMTTRTTKKTVTFNNPFVIGSFDEMQPAGDYVVETDEELIEGLSFPAYRRVLTLLHLHERPGRQSVKSTLTIDPTDLDAALARDQKSSSFPGNHETSLRVQ